MARDRQRAKQRQADRRSARLGARAAGDRFDGEANGAAEAADELSAGAPPEDTGRSDTVVRPSAGSEPVLAEAREPLDPSEGPGSRVGPTGAEVRPTADRGRLSGFFAGMVAELGRVQWPNRAQVTSLTGIVLGFVLIAGGYLGLLDAVFSRLVRFIL